MATIFNGRYTAKTRPTLRSLSDRDAHQQMVALRQMIPVANAMTPMMTTLFTHPEKGFLHAEFYWNFTGPIAVQYWRSFEDLERFARQPSDSHLEAWKKFNQTVGADGSVGIWHETYQIDLNQFEVFYGNMPKFGLGAAIEHVQAVGRRETARKRLGANKAVKFELETK